MSEGGGQKYRKDGGKKELMKDERERKREAGGGRGMERQDTFMVKDICFSKGRISFFLFIFRECPSQYLL